MRNISIKDAIPYIAAILIFLLITMIYFNPLLQGKKLRQDDIMRFKGMSKEIVDYREATGEEPLWTNAMFGGMPAYQISVKYKNNLFNYVDKALQLGLPRPAGYVFLYFLGFFILMLALRVNPWLGIAGAIAFAFSSYFFIILEAGHNSKAHAIAYMAPVLAGIILAYRGKYILGAILAGFFLALEIEAGHPQITYYLAIIVVILGIVEFINSLKEKKIPHFVRASGILLVAAVLAVLTHATNLWATYEYGEYTIRGKSELTVNQENRTSGLDKDYATQWSYGIPETFTLLIPNAKGGASVPLGNNPDALEEVDRTYKQYVAQSSQYWGNQPFTSGPVYVGAIIVFLFVLGMFILKGRLKWVLFTATVLSIFLSWGKNFMPLTDFFLEYVPGYNKFRAVSMTLVIAELCMPIIAILGLSKIIREPKVLKEKINAFYISLGLTAGISLVFYLFPEAFFNFLSRTEIQQFAQMRISGQNAGQINEFVANLKDARISIFRQDAIRSFIFILIAAGIIWLYSVNKLKKNALIALISVLILIDLAAVTHRYLNSEDFVRKSRMARPYQASIADQEIIKDPDPNYRVFNLSVSAFQDASTSYFHKSIGGYHGAKLRRYQELIDYAIIAERQQLVGALQQQSMARVEAVLENSSVLNMLNTKYIIADPSGAPLRNPYALGNAWFVDDFELVEDADAEIAAVQDFDAAETAIIDDAFSDLLSGYQENPADSGAYINLTEYRPNELTYKSYAEKPQLAVFSEIYYPKGWNVYVDGELQPHFRANYVLRAMIVPAGEHTIQFKFEPRVYRVGEAISLAASIVLLLLVIGGAYFEIRGRIAKDQ